MTNRKLSRRLVSGLLASILLLAASTGQAEPSTPRILPATAQDWSQAARRDVETAYRLFVDNHPGMFNTEDPGFAERLRRARRRGLQLASGAKDAAGFSATLDGFSAVLRDGHAQAFATLPSEAEARRWPGFLVAWRGDRLLVSASAVSTVPVGAQVLGCDGKDVKSLLRQNVFAFGGDPAVPGQWWTRGPWLFVDDGNPFVRLPERCRLSVAGKVSMVGLDWRAVNDQFKTWRGSINGDALAPGLTEPRPGLFWLALPTFQPDPATQATYRSAFEVLRHRHADVLSADALVIDLRRNQGGSSTWSEDAARAIWGDAAVTAVLSRDTSRVWWRASPGNARHVRGLVDMVRKEGHAEEAALIEQVANGLEAALAARQVYWIEPAPIQAPPVAVAPAFGTPVYVIVPGQCGSACLDALDLFSRLPSAKLIGAPSSADTDYMEVRVEHLPDGLAEVVIPTKLYRGRPRRSGEFYQPAIAVDDLDWSTATFRKVVETDLKR